MASDVMASIYIEHEFPTRSMRHTRTDEHDRESSCAFLDESDSNDATNTASALDSPSEVRPRRPEVPRSSTDPTATFSSHNHSPAVTAHRNRSPYSKSHLRTRSAGIALGAPAMARAHSWAGNPAAQTTDINAAPPNTSRAPARTRSPFKPYEDTSSLYATPPKMWYDIHGGSAIESIQEDSELDLTPRGQAPQSLATYSLSRSSSLRRRPASPLHTVSNASSSSPYPADTMSSSTTTTVTSANHSPSLGAQRFNEAYPSLHHYASSSSFSSISSTPTSARSRSPSISSLETIEDVPDLESEALEADRIERFKLAAERAENGEEVEDGFRRRSLDTPRAGFGFSRSGSRERKRWSVCGGERRADLDLETIWED